MDRREFMSGVALGVLMYPVATHGQEKAKLFVGFDPATGQDDSAVYWMNRKSGKLYVIDKTAWRRCSA